MDQPHPWRVILLLGLVTGVAAAGFVTVGAILPSAVFAILALSLSTGCVTGVEGPFFMTATAIGKESPGAAAGVLNLMGNLGGVLWDFGSSV